MSITITAYRGRGSRHLITILDTDGEIAGFADTDLMRLKIGEAPSVPILDVTNVVPPTKNTFLTPRNNPATLVLDQDDTLAMMPGIYDLEVGLVDDSDDDALRHASKGVFVLLDTQRGEVGNVS